jgi:hypothetical protein
MTTLHPQQTRIPSTASASIFVATNFSREFFGKSIRYSVMVIPVWITGSRRARRCNVGGVA